ncbi:hypothetical protein PIB30_076291 [Stylosanthes scabra]|uniref:Uncharacterized protein n=1 Tax=Stylosanthes scabra TaxID=79078 RepID=A0ABU6XST2_9FABA|nr:hypothetical protein [Stylosanthes scabra]
MQKFLRNLMSLLVRVNETFLQKANEQQGRATIMDTIEQVTIALENLITQLPLLFGNLMVMVLLGSLDAFNLINIDLSSVGELRDLISKIKDVETWPWSMHIKLISRTGGETCSFDSTCLQGLA